MEKGEPKLAPEWLKSVGNKSASASTSPLQSGFVEGSKFTKSKTSSINGTENNSGRPIGNNQATTSHLYRTSNRSNSDHPQSYSNFGRNRRSRDRYTDKFDNSDKPKKNLENRTHKDAFIRPSQAMTSPSHNEKWFKNSCSGESNNKRYSDSLLSDKYESERGFVSNGTGVGRACSSGVTNVKNGDKWTSLLAEIPSKTVSGVPNGGPVSSSSQVATHLPLSSTMTTPTVAGFNMAEAVAKSPRVQTTQVSNGNQRFEDLAIKQSRILIPVTPSAPKATAPSDRIKPKISEARQSSSHLSVTSSDALKTSRKLLVLKPTRERNGASSDPIPDTKSPATTMQRPSSNPVSPTAAESKLEKKLSSQARSRNDFFNLMRKKSMGDSGASITTQGQGDQSDKNNAVDDNKEVNDNGSGNDNGNGKTHPGPDALLCSEEEEAAFLRSLGWEENDDEEGLTEEEISSFYRDVTKYLNSKLPLKILQGVQPRLLLTLNS